MPGFAKNAYGEVIGFDAHKYHTIIVSHTEREKRNRLYDVKPGRKRPLNCNCWY